MNGKIHRAVVTEANLNYVGSVTIDPVLLEAADILPDEKVQIVNNNNGERLETYVIEGERHSGEICLNGAAARKVQVGDVVIIISYVQLEQSELEDHQPNVVIVDEENKIIVADYKEKRKTEYTAH
ncbi:L-aspartate 1-decarboxylase [Salinicoccus halodurans]|nr:L-aspartate 1-decarboxylase [Salinicoccus halodurans]